MALGVPNLREQKEATKWTLNPKPYVSAWMVISVSSAMLPRWDMRNTPTVQFDRSSRIQQATDS